jgi:hypothetical protein
MLVCAARAYPSAKVAREGEPNPGIPRVWSFSQAPQGDCGGSCSMQNSTVGHAAMVLLVLSMLLDVHVSRCLNKAQHSCSCMRDD